MKVYLVIDAGNSPGRVYAIMKDGDDAMRFANMLDEPCTIEERTLFYGQPPVRGFNE